MKSNLFIKSMMRQPLQTLILVVIIGFVTFAFVLRTAEFIFVRSEITELSKLYRAVGFLRHESPWGDVSEGLALLETLPNVTDIENRVTLEAVLQEMRNFDVIGMQRGLPNEAQDRITELIFTARLDRMDIQNHWIRLFVFVQELYAGYPEHTNRNRPTLIVNTNTLNAAERDVVLNMQTGGIYTFRTAYYVQLDALGLPVLPRFGTQSGYLDLRHLNDDYFIFQTHQSSEEAYQSLLDNLQKNIQFLNHHQRAVTLIPTRDMASLPYLQTNASMRMGYDSNLRYAMLLTAGRFLNLQDDLQENPVVVINSTFAWLNRLVVGDFITITISETQTIERFSSRWNEFIVRSEPEDEPQHVMTLEIVGITQDLNRMLGRGSYGVTFMYVPASLIPHGIQLSAAYDLNIPGGWHDHHRPGIWSHFQLVDARYEQEFIQAYAPMFEALGQRLILFESGAAQFWQAVDPLLLIVSFNFVIFLLTFVFIIVFVLFILMKQRQKEIAILRALGITKKTINIYFLQLVCVYFIPLIFIGSFLGWLVSMQTIYNILEPIGMIIPAYEPTTEFSLQWFFICIAAIWVFMLITALINLHFVHKSSILNQLQGVKIKKIKKSKHIIDHTFIATGQTIHIRSILEQTLHTKYLYKIKNHATFIVRHIIRTPMKSCMYLLITIFIMFTLGWLQESIIRAEQSIHDLYDTHLIFGEVRQRDFFANTNDRLLFDAISRHTVDEVGGSGLIQDVYIEGAHFRSFIVPMDASGGFPDDWNLITGYDVRRPILSAENMATLDALMFFNDFDLMMQEYYLAGYGGLEIEFYMNKSYHDFVYLSGMPIPIIVPYAMLARRNVSVGDEVFIGLTQLSPWDWRPYHSVIIGTHNSHLPREAVQQAVFVPMDIMEYILGGMTFYSTFNFYINPQYNRTIIDVRDQLEFIVQRRRAGMISLDLHLMDQILVNLVTIARQTLLFLELVYPIALFVSLVLVFGISFLLQLQNKKMVAMLSMVGTPKKYIFMMLITENMLVALFGVFISVLFLAVMQINLDMHLMISIILFFIVLIASNVIGAVIILKKKSLALLQVNE